MPKQAKKKVLEGELTIIFPNDSRFSLKGADEPKSLLGPGLDALGVDEAQDIKPDVYGTVLSPMLIGKLGRSMLIGTKRKNNWFCDLWLKAKRGFIEEAEAFYFPSFANPTIPKEEWSREQYSKPQWIWKREFVSDPFASDDVEEGIKYLEFDRRKHLEQPFEIPQDWRRFVGMDWGIRHPTTAVFAALNPKTGEIHVYDFYTRSEMNADAQAQEILGRCRDQKIEAFVLDSSCWRKDPDGTSIAEKFQYAGIKPLYPSKKEDKAYSQTSILKGYLKPTQGEPRIKFFMGMDPLFEQMESVTWDSEDNDDLTDALQYLVCFLSRIAIEPESRKELDWYDKNIVKRLPNGKLVGIIPRVNYEEYQFSDSGYLI